MATAMVFGLYVSVSMITTATDARSHGMPIEEIKELPFQSIYLL